MQNMALADREDSSFPDEVYKETGVNSVIEKDHWTMSLLIPGEVSEGSLRLFTGWQRQGDIL